MVTFTLVPFRLSDNPKECLHVCDVFAVTRETSGEKENPTKIVLIENAFIVSAQHVLVDAKILQLHEFNLSDYYYNATFYRL